MQLFERGDNMKIEEAEKILKGDVSGLDHGRPELVDWAEAFIVSYEYYKKEG